MAKKTQYTKPAKRSRPSQTFTQGLAAVCLAKAKPWGDNLRWTRADKANERHYLAVMSEVPNAQITCREDAIAFVDCVVGEGCEFEPEDWATMLNELRIFLETSGWPADELKAFQRRRGAGRSAEADAPVTYSAN